MTSHIQLALILFAAYSIRETKQNKASCHRLITESHLRNLTDLIDSQMKTSCKQSFIYVDKSELGNTECFLKAAYVPLLKILNEIKFKKNTPNFKKLERIDYLHIELGSCFDAHPGDKTCTKRFLLTPEEILQMVHDYFSEAKRFLTKSNFSKDCTSVFQKCSDTQGKEKMESSGVVTDQDGAHSDASPVNGGGSAFLLPAFESSSSIADHLDSKETADNTLQLFMLPDTTQTQGVAEGGTRPRVLRSTQKGQGAAESMDFHASTDAVMSAEEWTLTPVSQEPESLTLTTALLLEPAITQHQVSSHLRDVPLSPSQQHNEYLETKSSLPGSKAASGKAWPSVLPSQHLLSPSDPTLFHVLGSEDSVSVTQHPLRFLVATERSPSPRQISPENYSWGEDGRKGRFPGGHQSTQLRERRAERDEGMVKNREAEESLPGPSVDQNFIPLNADKHTKKPEPSDTRGMTVTYVTVASVLGILLALGGLLFYLNKSRILARRQPQQNNIKMERPEEGRPLNRGEVHIELQLQEEL